MGRPVHLAGLGVDDGRARVEVGAVASQQLAVHEGGRASDFVDAHRLRRRALDRHRAVGDLEVLGVDLQLAGRHRQDPLAHLAGRLQHGVSGHERGPRRERAGAHRRRVGVGVVVGDPVVGDADSLGHDLRLDGLGPVADVGRAREHVHPAVGLDLDPGLRRVAVLVHAGGVLDGGDSLAAVQSHQWPPPDPIWAIRWSGSMSSERSALVMDRSSSLSSVPVDAASDCSTSTVLGSS